MKRKTTSFLSGRAIFCNEIVSEYWMPRKASCKAVIICDGAPAMPAKRKLAEYFVRKGYWVFHARYRGTWESKGEFLGHSPAQDIDDVIEAIPLGFQDVYSGTTYFIELQEVVVVGASFGGAAAILAARNPKVTKAIAIAPVVDWSVETKTEPFAVFVHQLTAGFPGAYRAQAKNFTKLLKKRFYNPVDWTHKLDGNKLFLVHAKDDPSVPFGPTKKLAKKIHATYVEYKTGGHLSSSMVLDKKLRQRIERFLGR